MIGVLRCAASVLMAAALSACAAELVVLLPGGADEVGEVEVRNRSSAVTLASAYAGARAGPLGVDPVAVSEARVRREFAGALAAVPPAPLRYTLYFEEGTTSVVAASRESLARLLADVRRRATATVEVTGHTDRLGSVDDNDRLARERAAMVRAQLVRLGLDPASVRAVGRGEREPLVATADEVREPRNRRVVVTVR